MLLWISLNSCTLNMLLARSHQAEKIIAKRFIHGRNDVTRARVEHRFYNQVRCKNNGHGSLFYT